MDRHITVPSAARGCTMQLIHSAAGRARYSVALYQALATRGQPLVQLAYATGDAIELTAPRDGSPFHVLWLSEDNCRRACFEVTADAAESIADFAGIALVRQQAAA
jgi:RES domain-containing protein